MRRPVILGGTPYITDYYKKSAEKLFLETGGNTGNLAFEYAIASHLAGNVQILEVGTPPQIIRAAGDVIVLPLANQLGKHTDLGNTAAILDEINLPVVGIGLGAQAALYEADITLTEGTERWLRTLARLAPSQHPNLGVRGPYTKSQIDRFGLKDAAVVMGCPSNFINVEANIADKIAAGFKRQPRIVAVAAGIPHIPILAKLEQNLVAMVDVTGGAYIVQHGLEMLQLARNEFEKIKPDRLELCRNYIWPGKSTEEFVLWCRKYAYAFYDARAWMDFLTRFDFVVGTRIHGAMLALQAGIPAACIAHDSRTLELCQTMGVPVRHYSEISTLTNENLLDHFSFDKEKFSESRRELHKQYVSIYRAADIEIKPKLERMFS